MSIANAVALTIHLEVAESAIKRGDFHSGLVALKLALEVANAGNRNDVKPLIFRAMNVVRAAIKRAEGNRPQVVDLRAGEYAVIEVR